LQKHFISSRPRQPSGACKAADRDAAATLIEVVCPEFRRLAARYLRHERPVHAL
jgi:hypothetical protein